MEIKVRWGAFQTSIWGVLFVVAVGVLAPPSSRSLNGRVNMVVGSVVAAEIAPIVDAGPAKVIALPATDLTLFGHATDSNNDPFTIEWTMTSGPAAVTFSAPWALATTVTFTTGGSYTFQLAVSDGTSTVTSSTTVTVLTAASQTAFYVDPNYTGTGNGSAQMPWSSLGTTYDTPQSAAINAALADGPVIVYFSAREAADDVPEELIGSLHLLRTDTSTNRLTLDGMSKYNTNDASPSWVDYSGSSKMRVKVVGSDLGIGWSYEFPDMNYVTIRGFEVTGSSGRITFKGSHNVLEYIWSHDITTTGATIQVNGATDAACTDKGRNEDITFRNILVERGVGEGIYVGGNYPAVYGGCDTYGNTHSDILIENNTIRDPGYNGDEGDGIDLKWGLQNVTVRNNVIENTHGGGSTAGITSLGVDLKVGARANYLFEGNRIFNTERTGINFIDGIGVVIRNNIVYGTGASIYVAGVTNDGVYDNSDVEIYNNTIMGTINLVDVNRAKVMNNLVLAHCGRSCYPLSSSNSINITSDYNILSAPGYTTFWPEGPHTIIVPDTTGATILVNPGAGDFHLKSGSAAIDKATDLTSTGFASDFNDLARPQGAAWDIGANESPQK